MDQSLESFRKTAPGQVSAGLAQTQATNPHSTYIKLLADQFIEADAFGHHVPSRVPCRKRETGVSREAMHIFLFNEGNFKVRLLRLGRKSPKPKKIAVAHKSFSGHSPDLGF